MDLEMKGFISWQLKQESRSIFRSHLIVISISFIVFLLYKLAKGVCFQIVSILTSTPSTICAFFGFTGAAETGNIGFFLGSSMALMSVVLIVLSMKRTMRIAYRDDKNGMLYLMLNQWYSREQLLHARIAVAMIQFVAGYFVWYVIVIFLAVIGSLNNSQRINNIGLISRIMCQSITVGMLLIFLTFTWMYVSKSNMRQKEDANIGFFLMSTLVLGNIYKIRDLVAYLIETMGGNPVGFLKGFRFLDVLYWCSPLSWINPYRNQTLLMLWLQVILSVLASILLFVWINSLYKRYSFHQ